ncbi:signal peptidase II [bacterium]|nr:signal peptidase II [bacterium]
MKRGVGLVFLLFALDILLKQFVMSHVPLYGNLFSFHLFSFLGFELTYVQNTGMAWGMLASFQSVILLFRVVFIGALIYFLIHSEKMQRHLLGYLLVIFGAFANVLDTLLYGFVVDMLHFTFWDQSYGIFNVADAMIFAGAFLIVFVKERPYALNK